MAKKGAAKVTILECSVCHAQNYVTKRNPTNTKDKLDLSKFCKKCRKHTEHKEVK